MLYKLRSNQNVYNIEFPWHSYYPFRVYNDVPLIVSARNICISSINALFMVNGLSWKLDRVKRLQQRQQQQQQPIAPSSNYNVNRLLFEWYAKCCVRPHKQTSFEFMATQIGKHKSIECTEQTAFFFCFVFYIDKLFRLLEAMCNWLLNKLIEIEHLIIAFMPKYKSNALAKKAHL